MNGEKEDSHILRDGNCKIPENSDTRKNCSNNTKHFTFEQCGFTIQ